MAGGDLAEVVQEALRRRKAEEQQRQAEGEDHDGPLNGTAAAPPPDETAPIPTSHPLKSKFIDSPKRQNTVEEPESFVPASRPSSRPRGKQHRSQASFDWFGSGSTSFPLENGSGSSAAAGPSTSKNNSLTTSGPSDDTAGKGTELRGVFSDEDLDRGANFLKGATPQKEKRKRPARGRSSSFTEAQSKLSSNIFSTSDRKGKARSEHPDRDPDGAEWEDELRDGFAEGASTPQRPGMGPKKHSLWGTRSKHGSGSSTLDEASSNNPAGQQKRPKQIRRGTGWNALRNRLKGSGQAGGKGLNKSLTGHELITELSIGILPMAMIKMGVMDRDERGEHRIPILMNYLKLRITDSVYPFHDRHAVFRIELEYGDGLVKWVIYRELKDFVNLHAHYRLANLRVGIDKFPTFPKTSLPYLNWLKSEGRKDVGRAEFAKAQRDALETYLLKLIRATMFGAGANRLCKFLEISAMSVALAQHGGEQGKQGYLRIMSSGASRKKASGFHPFSWKARHDPKWFVVRDSYILAVDDPASTDIYDVFMIDSSFEIERPKRVYRQGIDLLHNKHSDSESEEVLRDEPLPQGKQGAGDPLDPSSTAAAEKDEKALKSSSNHMFYLNSSERRLRLVAKTERQQDQFIASIENMVARSIWAGKNRFDSFSPIRLNVAAQWLIDGRDYFWSLSRAIMLAKSKIYIHDWWLSPELYLRRPPAENEKWRLDRLLQRKAREGVQIFVIVYKEVSNDFTPVDSNYTKTRLRGLHPNIHVQRSPSHTSTGTLFWSHHEKMCVIDETIGFMGGLDLCFGRWDSPGHAMVDGGVPPSKVQPKGDTEGSQIWPGKDYANDRVLNYHTLNKPEEDMLDRSKVPRQPWHDIGLQLVGQPARDLCRHFIQRWNYLLRIKNHTIKMPFLLPPPDFTAAQLQKMGIMGTCEVQICRSVGPWSMGVSEVEHSIQNAYIKAIQLSDHFVYIENQFFITSTEVEGVQIENKIGDALVSRILRAHAEGSPWRAVIVIPLVPGYPFPIDHSDAGSVRLIMECQNRTISRGDHSIYARLRREGIDPEEYITFFGLRGWGKLPNDTLTTEAVYIHAKSMIVDDRTVIIGSANINERSQRGDRDSELACVIRDTDMIDSTMAGEPYKVGRFAHTMRVRLMREHLGIDVDEVEADENQELAAREPEDGKETQETWDPEKEQEHGDDSPTKEANPPTWTELATSAADKIGGVFGTANDAAGIGLQKAQQSGGHAVDVTAEGSKANGHANPASPNGEREESAKVPTMEETVEAESRPKHGNKDDGTTDEIAKPPQENGADNGHPGALVAISENGDQAGSDEGAREDSPSPSKLRHKITSEKLDQSDAGSSKSGHSAAVSGDPSIDSRSPLNHSNSRRGKVNGMTPASGSQRKNRRDRPNAYSITVPAPKIDPDGMTDPLDESFFKDVWMTTAVRNTQAFRKVFRCVPDDLVQTWKQYREFQTWAERHNKAPKDSVPPGDEEPYSDPAHHSGQHGAGGGGTGGGAMGQGSKEAGETMNRTASRRNRAASVIAGGGAGAGAGSSAAGGEGHDHEEGFPAWEREQMEECLGQIRGTLVVFPTRFLEAESAGGNFLFSKDRLPPLSIYD